MLTWDRSLRIGFISTRFEGTDGVSLETEKWAAVLEKNGHQCFYFAGICDRPADVSMVVPEAFFQHPDNASINRVVYSSPIRPPDITRRIHSLKNHLKDELYRFISQFDLNLLITENVQAIPIHIPLGMALAELIAETGFPVIGHHHDMFWERKRFLTNCVWDILNSVFPPHMPTIRHVVINSSASNQLALRTGISSTLIPNVMDFDHPPPPPDDYAKKVRRDLGLDASEYLILQPTRIVQRKGIEHAIELVSRLFLDARLVISHASGDEGYEYEKFIREYAERLGVPTLFIADIIKEKRGLTEDGRNIYTLNDVYPQAALVTYPSDFEGFGNAFLEAIYYRRPVLVNNYSIFNYDIRPKGFRVIEFDGYITQETVETARRVLQNPSLAAEMAEHNYLLGQRHFSYTMLERRLHTIISSIFGE
ncbi:glycosyltransferase family 4 protein [Leptolinea tardivitalis]|uniref:Glycosyl transferase family 1 n=1 Tax=Leptolinea tardivitalis TaxID=229920 RepID=A0A0P6XI21_9CHLR|nr:glycosyltransferase family 4 protein [Leptolinea tardivitalis]KPL75133.1 glycosyl transferase family 1 [Leptolinea tardivitalis]GAP20384.1 glycosyltransferase [Leptolinea tardivitalis]